MSVIRISAMEQINLPGRTLRFLVTGGTQNSSDKLTSCYTDIPVGSALPQHTHIGSDEIMYCVRGRAEAVLDGVHEPFCAGDVFFVPADMPHFVINKGAEGVEMFCVFANPIDVAAYEKQAQ